jgi:hypothetical protein
MPFIGPKWIPDRIGDDIKIPSLDQSEGIFFGYIPMMKTLWDMSEIKGFRLSAFKTRS